MTTPNIEELHGLAEEFEDRGCHIDDIGFNGGSTSVNKLMRRYFEGLIVHAPALLDALQSQAERIKELNLQVVSAFGQAQEALEERDTLRAQLDALQVDDELPKPALSRRKDHEYFDQYEYREGKSKTQKDPS